ncbi:uncharacterized protein Gasu_16350 [Galdieria sulphuraria]|uniref:Glycosyltransferase 2-like domain-containing protein n=1 Tax=Galdieria sulphuraria TaxID=130081 RepID=M2Y5L0_GALSU|nr:uncharacterized protein Gasu_16350 [Galdieria sulphuraria]EME31139.1 hypothetical protein Gasu_16350 [Galdieria sulphuraria]|eukprot:XP_005707659.1 hypothetical protein Gasu_16350 [Galdieria sulphuraria]
MLFAVVATWISPRRTYVLFCILSILLFWFSIANLNILTRSKTFKLPPCDIAALTIGYNEECLAAFTVASVLLQVDRYVFVDTNSFDRTVSLIKHIFSEEVKTGKLRIISKGIEDFDVSSARNEGLQWLKNQNCTKLLKIDADEVFYRAGARLLVDTARYLEEDVSEVEFCEYELYQNEVETNTEWMKALYKDIVGASNQTIFYQFPHIPSKQRIFNHLQNIYASGKWTDEAEGKSAENLHTTDGKVMRLPDIVNVHYGWARNLEYKRNKSIAWMGKPEAHPWVNSINPRDPSSDLKQFKGHPEVIYEYIERVSSFLNIAYDKV